MDPADGAYRRSLGLLQTTASGVAMVVGAGVFVLLAPATRDAGGAVWLAFVVAGGLSALTALSYMELASMFPRAGSEMEFASRVFPAWMSFLVGWSMGLALVVASATVALGFAGYMGQFVSWDARLMAVAMVAGAAALSAAGMAKASRVIVGLAVIQVGGLIWVVVLGIDRAGSADLLAGGGLGGVVSAAALIFFAFIGFDEVITLSEETRDPARTIPRALFLSLAISTVLYAAVAVSAVAVLGPDAVGASQRPIADLVTARIGSAGGNIAAGLAIVATASTVVLALTAASRMVWALADKGHLHPRFAAVRRGEVPVAALVLVAVVAAGLVGVRDLKLLASATDALIYLMFLVTNVVAIVLRRTMPDAPRPFRMPGTIARVPVVPVVAIVVTVVLAARLEASAILWGAGIVAVGAFYRRIVRCFPQP